MTKPYDPATRIPDPPAELAPVAALAALATEMEFDGLGRYAERVRAILPHLGYLVVTVDQLSADAAMLAAYAPGEQVPARHIGEQLLEVVTDTGIGAAHAREATERASAAVRRGAEQLDHARETPSQLLAVMIDKTRRYDLAVKLGDIPAACWSALMDWAYRGYVLVEHEDGTLERSPVPRTGTALPCMVEAIEQARPCYCGRFGATRALPAAALDPVDADVDETPDEYDEPDPDLAHDRRVADQLGVL